jgi:hypothetical protein
MATFIRRNVLRGRAAPKPVSTRFCLCEIEPTYQHRQFLGPHCDAASLRPRRPRKSSFLESFGADPQSAAIPHQRFDSRATTVREEEQVTAQRIVPELITHHTVQSVEAFAHVDCVHAEVDACRWTEAEHSYTRSAAPIRSGNSASPHSMRRPFASIS